MLRNKDGMVALFILYISCSSEVTNVRPAKEFREAREAVGFYYFRLLFVSVDKQFFSFLTGFIV